MKYTATIGNKYRMLPFESIPLKLDHAKQYLPAYVTYKDPTSVYIYTDLEYNVGQFVSIAGYPVSGRKFKAIEISITDYPVLEGAMITEREEI